MFCRNCGAELPDNAKFCRMCGEKLTAAEQPAPAPAPSPATATEQTVQPTPVITSAPEQPDPIPPYAPNHQQPMPQPYQQPMPVSQTNAGTGNGKVAGLIAAFFGIFFICTMFIKTYAVGKLDYSVYTFIDSLSESASRLNKNVFSFTADIIARSEWYSAPLYIALWVDVFFALLAVIMLILAFCRIVSTDARSEVKMWGDIKCSALFSFIGNFLVIASIYTGNIAFNVIRDRDLFEKWSMIPGVFAYVFIVLEFIVFVFCGIRKRKAKKALSAQAQPYPAPAAAPYNNY